MTKRVIYNMTHDIQRCLNQSKIYLQHPRRYISPSGRSRAQKSLKHRYTSLSFPQPIQNYLENNHNNWVR